MRCPPRERRSARPAATGPRPRSAGFRGESGDAPGSVPVSVPVASAVPVAGASFGSFARNAVRGARARVFGRLPRGKTLLRRGGRVRTRLGERGGRVADLVSRGRGHELRKKRARVLLGRPTGRLPRGRPEASAVAAAAAAGAAGGRSGSCAPRPRRPRLRRRAAPGARAELAHNGRSTGVSVACAADRVSCAARLARSTSRRASRRRRLRLPGGRPRGRLGGCSKVVGGQQSSRTSSFARDVLVHAEQEIASIRRVHGSVRTGANTTSVGASSVSAARRRLTRSGRSCA